MIIDSMRAFIMLLIDLGINDEVATVEVIRLFRRCGLLKEEDGYDL